MEIETKKPKVCPRCLSKNVIISITGDGFWRVKCKTCEGEFWL